jgi:hypothetical protein
MSTSTITLLAACERLGISKSTLNLAIKKLGIESKPDLLNHGYRCITAEELNRIRELRSQVTRRREAA